MERLTSRENEQIKFLSRLMRSKRERHAAGMFVAEGARLCAEALENRVEVLKAYLVPGALERYPQFARALTKTPCDCVEITPELSNRLSDTDTPQGVFCLCRMLDNGPHTVKIDTDGQYLALCGLQDPGNVGTIIRTAEAMGLTGLILAGSCPDIYSPKVLRSTMGSVFRLPIRVAGDEAFLLQEARAAGVKSYAAALHRQACLLPGTGLGPGSLVLIGNEGNGLPDAVVQACDAPLMIQMPGRAESLNAAMAAGIIVWEMARARLSL